MFPTSVLSAVRASSCKIFTQSTAHLHSSIPNVAGCLGLSSIHLSKMMSTDSPQSAQNSQEPFSGQIPMDQLEFKSCRSGGAGGQHVNKVETKVELRFNIKQANWIPEWIKPRLIEKQANRITKHGELIITSDKTRKQILNRGDCLNRLRTMIFDASVLPKEPTETELALAEKRKAKRVAAILKEKRHHSLKKTMRGSQGHDHL